MYGGGIAWIELHCEYADLILLPIPPSILLPTQLPISYQCSGPPARNSDSREARATRESPGPPASPHDSWVARSTRETAE